MWLFGKGKVESSPHRLSSSWEETLLLALSHPDISLCSNPHNRSQANAQASREPNTHPGVLLYTPITGEQCAFLASRPLTDCVSLSEFCVGKSVTWQNSKRSKRSHIGRDESTTEKDSGNTGNIRYTGLILYRTSDIQMAQSSTTHKIGFYCV